MQKMRSEEMVTALGVEMSDVRYLGKVNFVEIPEETSEDLKFNEGAVVLTDTDFFIFEDGLERSTSEAELHIPIAEMVAVGICHEERTKTHQLQIKQEGRLIALNGDEGKPQLNNSSVQKLHKLILEDEVAAWTCPVYYAEDPSTGEVIQAVAVEVVGHAIGHVVMEGIIHLLFFGF